MTEYQFHAWPSGTIPSVRLQAESPFHGAALALRHFKRAGCDIIAPGAHLDMIDADGGKQMLLVEEVLDWLGDPKQSAFIHREDLADLLA
jgi:hypothetical protein